MWWMCVRGVAGCVSGGLCALAPCVTVSFLDEAPAPYNPPRTAILLLPSLNPPPIRTHPHSLTHSVKAFVGGPLSNSSTALNVLGRLEHARGDYEAAASLYTRALTLRPNDSALFQNLGGAYASQGEHQMAFASFQRAIDLDPEDRYTYLKLGMMYESLGAWGPVVAW